MSKMPCFAELGHIVKRVRAIRGRRCSDGVSTITGGRTLEGRLRPAAAKNSVLPLLAATLLCDGSCALRTVPYLRDVETSLSLLAAVGGHTIRYGTTLHTQPGSGWSGDVPVTLASAMRGSVFYLAPLLHRAGSVRLPLPGGCDLGPRPVDLHLAGLAAMGAQVEMAEGAILLRRKGLLHGTDFTLRLPSVGATLTIMLAATVAHGTTVLRGAACEPEIEDVAAFLNLCGAQIVGAGTPTLVIHGVPALDGACYTPLPDRIVACTYAAAVAAAGGQLHIEPCRPEQIALFCDLLCRMGCGAEKGEQSLTVTRDPAKPLHGGIELCAAAYPGFATDAAPLAAAMLLTAQGESTLYDGLFQNRFACAAGFAAMGAEVRVQGRKLHLAGTAKLQGTEVTVPDLRGGAALCVAALAAEGTTTLWDPGHLRRGYEHLIQDLVQVGADAED